MLYLAALLIGVIAGLRAMTPFAAVSWGARLGYLAVAGTWMSFLASSWAPWLFTVLALVELVTDQLPKTPSRKVPVQFGARIASGAFAGMAILGASPIGAVLGVVGAVIGTFGGAAMRGSLAKTFGKDPPAAFIEDAVALGGAALVVVVLAK